MKKNLNIFTICMITIICSFTCNKPKNCHTKLNFINSSNKDIYFQSCGIYPDTLLSSHYCPNPKGDKPFHFVSANNNNNLALPVSQGCYESNNFNTIDSDTMMIYIFDANVIETTSWDTVKAKNLYLKRYDLSLQDLQQSNWTIKYP